MSQQPSKKQAEQSTKKAQKQVEKTAEEIGDKAQEAKDKAEKNAQSVLEHAEEIAEATIESAQRAAHSAKEAVTEAAENFNERARELTAEAKKDLEKFSEKAIDASGNYSEKIADEFKDPAITTTVLFTAVTASAASTYLTQQHKQGKLTALVTAGVVIGVAALSAAEYFSVKAYFKRNNASSSS